mgnify:CR=1 FL=1|jgi:CRP-like cAMP-binding protein
MIVMHKSAILENELGNFKWILCSVDPDLRTEDECIMVIKFLQDLEYLSKGEPRDYIELAKELKVKTYKDSHVVCREGDYGEEVYYILRGSVQGVSVIK